MFKILVVEDDPQLNHAVCSHLLLNGYEVAGCLGANEAYDAMYSQMFDLIVSDIMMPGIDGFEFVQTVRRLNQNIPILFMTARDDFTAKLRGYQAGIDDFMVKPINLEELLLSVLLWVIDLLYRHFTVDRHVHRIIRGLGQIQRGDFSVRIAPIEPDTPFNELDEVIAGINRMTQELAGVEVIP